MFAEGIKVDGIPCPIVPSVMLLDIVAIVVAIHMESNACVILASDGNSIDVNGHLLVGLMIDQRDCFKPSVLAISGS